MRAFFFSTRQDTFAEPDPLYLHAGFWPLGPRKGWLGRIYTTFCCREAPKYFKLRVVTEEGAVFDPSKPYVVGEWTQLQELLPHVSSTMCLA